MTDGARTNTKQRPENLVRESLWSGVAQIYAHASPERRRQLFLLLGLMLMGVCAELASIGTVLPFLSLLANPADLAQFPWAIRAFDAIGAASDSERLLIATLAFVVFVSLAGTLRIFLAWFTQEFIFGFGQDLALEVQRRILSQPYSFHIQRNSSTLIAGMEKTEQLTFVVLLPLMQAVIAAIVALFIIAALVYIDPFVASIAAATFLAMYVLVLRLTRRRLLANSAAVAEAWDERLKRVQESLGGIRDIILDDSRPAHLREFARSNRRLYAAYANNVFIGSAPRFAIETVGLVAIALIALVISNRDAGFAAALPVLGAVAMGAMRLLPLLQQVYHAWSTLAGSEGILAQVLDLLRLPIGEEPDPGLAPLPLRKSICFDNVSFTFPGRRRRAISGVRFEVPAHSSMALVGETGSGKSTVADLLMGLLEPNEGEIVIDGAPLTKETRRRWQRSIAHVPQSIFLADTSIAQNIALGVTDEQPDMDRVVEASKAAQLHDFVCTLPDGYETLVGERGIRLSGGQRQRLGIARAIYKKSPVLLLDEATSALDEQTERAVMDGLYGLRDQGRTLIIIAHRASTIQRCDIVARLQNGRLVETSGRIEGRSVVR